MTIKEKIIELATDLTETDAADLLRDLEAKLALSAPSRGSYCQAFRAHAAAIPRDLVDLLPDDLAENHDHYLYGVPKR